MENGTRNRTGNLKYRTRIRERLTKSSGTAGKTGNGEQTMNNRERQETETEQDIGERKTGKRKRKPGKGKVRNWIVKKKKKNERAIVT